jgi:hypothetical protein
MPDWCDYNNFTDSLEWLAGQDDRKIEEFQCSQTAKDEVVTAANATEPLEGVAVRSNKT